MDAIPFPAGGLLSNQRQLIRSCCRLYERYCSGLLCCYPAQSTSKPKLSEPAKSISRPRNDGFREQRVANIPSPPQQSVGRNTPLTLSIRGMDCIDCSPRVTKSLARLSSVQPQAVNYFS